MLVEAAKKTRHFLGNFPKPVDPLVSCRRIEKMANSTLTSPFLEHTLISILWCLKKFFLAFHAVCRVFTWDCTEGWSTPVYPQKRGWQCSSSLLSSSWYNCRGHCWSRGPPLGRSWHRGWARRSGRSRSGWSPCAPPRTPHLCWGWTWWSGAPVKCSIWNSRDRCGDVGTFGLVSLLPAVGPRRCFVLLLASALPDLVPLDQLKIQFNQ